MKWYSFLNKYFLKDIYVLVIFIKQIFLNLHKAQKDQLIIK